MDFSGVTHENNTILIIFSISTIIDIFSGTRIPFDISVLWMGLEPDLPRLNFATPSNYSIHQTYNLNLISLLIFLWKQIIVKLVWCKQYTSQIYSIIAQISSCCCKNLHNIGHFSDWLFLGQYFARFNNFIFMHCNSCNEHLKLSISN